jgi:hypothetical protein
MQPKPMAETAADVFEAAQYHQRSGSAGVAGRSTGAAVETGSVRHVVQLIDTSAITSALLGRSRCSVMGRSGCT